MHLDRRSLLGAGAALAASGLAPARAGQGEADLDRPGRTAHTRFAVNLEMWWSALPFDERIHRAAELGFPAVEFWSWRDKDVGAIGRACRELGLAVAQFTAWGFRPPLNDPANHAAFAAEIAESCRVAADLGAERMTVVAGDDRPGATREAMHAAVVLGLQRAAETAAARGVTLLLEPMNVRVDHPGHCLWGSAPAVAICRAVGSPQVKINWDLYHMQISEGDLCGHLAEGFSEVGYLQVADHPGRHEPGTGEIHYTRVLRAAHELGYRGFVGLECAPSAGELTAARAVARADHW